LYIVTRINGRFIFCNDDIPMIGISATSVSAASFADIHASKPVAAPQQDMATHAEARSSSHASPGPNAKLRPDSLLNADNLLLAQSSDPPKKPGELGEAEEKVVKELKARDAEVRHHEEAHARAGGAYAGTPTYQYQNGPDGRQYAIGGKTSIDISPIAGDPEATLRKMEVIKRAASAPADPSGADRAVIAGANATAQAARAELARERQEEQQSIHETPENQDEEVFGHNMETGPVAVNDFVRSTDAYKSVAALQLN
jgi:hypothetical protein